MNLEGKTIFDFCHCQEVLDFITSKKTREQYEANLEKEDALFDLAMLAFIIQNEEIRKAVQREVPVVIDWDMDVHNLARKYQDKSAISL